MSFALEKNLLLRLKQAQDRDSPLTVSQLGREIDGSTFEDMWARGYIGIRGQEDCFVCVADKSSCYVVTASGLEYLARL